MTGDKIKNMAASVRQRLLNRAKAEGRPFQEVLQYFAMERFLYRFSKSEYRDSFYLKGALMLRVWDAPEKRSTMDIDLLGKTNNTVDNIESIVKQTLAVEVEDDGLVFDQDSVNVGIITEAAEYEGIRVKFVGFCGNAKINMQIDIGFGDVIHPQPEETELPTILEFAPPSLLCYSRESVVAEKLEAMVKLGELNSRMKDFYDIWLLSRMFDFDGEILLEAVRLTFERRSTEIPREVAALTEAFAHQKQTQWTAFRNRVGDEYSPDLFADVVKEMEPFVRPLFTALRTDKVPPGVWIKSEGWKSD